MKVVKSGKDNYDTAKEFVCKGEGVGKKHAGCGAVLLIKPCDVERKYYEDGDDFYWFVCPECGIKTYVKPKDFS